MLIRTLSNGIRAFVLPVNDMHSVTCGISICAGSKHESNLPHGVAHLLEHMIFKGTEEMTPKAIAYDFERDAIRTNAYTHQSLTTYYAKGLAPHLTKMLELFSKMLASPCYREFDREREVVLDEVKVSFDDPMSRYYEMLNEIAYEPKEFAMPIGGYSHTVSEIQISHLKEFYDRYYNPQNMMIAIAGKIDAETVFDQLEQSFSNFSCNENSLINIPEGPGVAIQTDLEIRYVGGFAAEKKEVEQIHFILALPAFSIFSDMFYATELLTAVLGSGMSSRLFNEVREERGLTYSISAFTDCNKHCGILCVDAFVRPHNIKEIIEVIINEIKQLAYNGITDDELYKVKNKVASNLLISHENPYSRAAKYINDYLIFGEHLEDEEILKKITAVTKEDVQNCMKKILSHLQDQKLTFVACGNIDQLEEYGITYDNLFEMLTSPPQEGTVPSRQKANISAATEALEETSVVLCALPLEL